MAQLNFDASQVAPDTGVLDALPAGWYNVSMDASEMKPTKDGSGAFLECRFSVLDGQYKDRKVFSRFNLRNNNPQAVEIAYKQLSALCHAAGVMQVQDSSMLHNRPVKIKVTVRPADGQYEASNDIKAYRNINDQSVGSTTGTPAGMPPAQAFAPQAAATPFTPQAPAPVPPAAAPQAPAWQPPAGQQPWQGQQAPQQPAPQQWAPQQPASQQAPQQPQQPQQPAWAAAAPQQPQPPVGAPGGVMPPWMSQPAQ